MAASEGPEVLDLSNADTKRVIRHFKNERNSKLLCYYTTQAVDSNRSFVKIFCRDPATRRAFAERIVDFLSDDGGRRVEKTPEEAFVSGIGVNGHHANGQHHPTVNGGLINGHAGSKLTNGGPHHSPPAQTTDRSQLKGFQHTVEEPNGKSENGFAGAQSSRSASPPDLAITISDEQARVTEEEISDRHWDVFTSEVIKKNIQRPERKIKDLVLLRPYAAQFLHGGDIKRPTAIQRAAWPDLFEKKSMVLIGPRASGKTFAYLPVALTFSLENAAVVLTATDGRVVTLCSTLSYHQLPIDITRPPSKIYNSRKQLLICNLHWFYNNRRKITPSVVIFDKLDQMVESASDVTCVEVAKSCGDIPLIATARRSSPPLEKTLELMNITSCVMAKIETRPRNVAEYLISIDDASDPTRYAALISTLRRESPDDVVLIFFLDETEVNVMYDKLDEEAHKGSVPFTVIHNLREKLEDDRNLLRSFLNEGNPGVYLACLQDHTWLYTTRSIHTVINYRPPDCDQAYRYRRERLCHEGKVLTITRGADINLFTENLFYIMSNVPGYDPVNPQIDRLRKVFEDERKLRNTLRCRLLS